MGRFDDLGDAECKRILAMSHDEIVAETIARGEDPQKVIEEVNRLIGQAKVENYRRYMKL